MNGNYSMKKRPKQHQHCIQVHKPRERYIEDYYFEYDPVYKTLRVRLGGPTGQIIKQYSYDQQGNLQQAFDQYIEYNDLNQVVRVRAENITGTIIEECAYDTDGSRAIKFEPQINQTTYYVSDSFIEVANSTGNYKYVYYHQDGTLVARKDPDGSKLYYHPDNLGSTDLVRGSAETLATF